MTAQNKMAPEEIGNLHVEENAAGEVTLESKLDRIRLHKTSKLQHQKQLSVILDAVEQTLKEQNTELSPSAYVIALLSLLNQAFSDDEIKNPELASSVVYLLDTVLPHAPPQLLISKFASILVYISPSLTHADASPALIRSAIGCLESILIAQDTAAWRKPASELGPRKALNGIMSLALDERPKVRKRAQEGIANVLSHPPAGPSPVHPAVVSCTESTLRSIDDLYAAFRSDGQKRKAQSGGAPRPAEKRLIFALQLTRSIAGGEGGWPAANVEALCHVLLTISRSAEEYLVTASMDVFQALFSSMAESADEDNKLDAAKFEKIASSILDLRPSESDQHLAPSWLAILAQCFQAYSDIDEIKTFNKLPELFETVAEFMQAGLPENVVTSAAQCLIALATTCIPVDALVAQPLAKSTKQTLAAIAATANSFLSVKYQTVWRDVFTILTALFDAFGFVADPYLIDILVTVGELRTGGEFEGRAEADEVIGAAIRALGPEKVLAILPLNLESPGPGKPGRAFLLPLLRDNIRNATLGHYVTEMAPLGDRLYQKVESLGGDSERTVQVKIYETLVEQIWALLPRYCDLPLDLRDSFTQPFAEALANVLYQRVELRQVVCKSLRVLVESNKLYVEGAIDGQNPFLEARLSKEEAGRNLEYLGGMASKFLAVLFNVFNQTVSEHRVFILDTINSFLSITSAEDIKGTFQKVVSLLTPALEKSASKKKDTGANPTGKFSVPPVSHTMMDLAVAMVPYLPISLYGELSKIFMATIQNPDSQLQKRGYRIITRMAQSEDGAEFLVANIDSLEGVIAGASEKVTPPSRGARMSALIDVVRILPSSDLHFIPVILPEAVIGTKEVNEKTREAAYNLLVAMGDKMAGGGSVAISKVPNMDAGAADVEASIDEFFTMVSAGLAGATPHMISASITALSRLLYQYKSILNASVIEELVATIDLFLTSKNREIVKAALGFVKVIVTSLPKEFVEPKLATLVPNLLEWAHEHHARFKLKVKHLLERLVRRFGVEAMEKVFPEADKKLLTNIRKTKERAARKKEAEGAEDAEEEEEGKQQRKQKKFLSEFEEAIYGSDSDSEYVESDDEETRQARKAARAKTSVGGRKKKGETYIVDDDDDPLDLLDKKTLARISSTKPTAAASGAARKSRMSKVRVSEASGKMLVDDEEANKKAIDPDAAVVQKLAASAAEANPVNAYLDAVKNGPVRGQRNKLKYKNKRGREEEESDEERAAPKPRRRAKF
ncbi:NUC173 domain-containing protein [Myxozyma melibiosi]|uniref:NUC173 domain-containing protein n=1 Tax=Myxozyma melibiosi TaxID=54550 RepID=A0ABR1F220_9ASCO